jgi:hypothetical protein
MSDNPNAAHIRLLPTGSPVDEVAAEPEVVETTDESTTPDELDPFNRRPLPESVLGEIKDEEADTGVLLDKIIDRKSWPVGARVGDGTPGPGRPRSYNIDERIVRAMALVGGTLPEIAAHFGCSETLIQKRYGELIREAKASRRIRLRQKQYQKALEGDTGMLIWLGKQELGQTDERHVRYGDLSRFSDEELAQIAAGKVPGQLGAGAKDEEIK